MSYKEVCYDMSHKQRGHCVIFNHTDFDSHTGLGKRTGSEVSCQQLVTLFTRFGFIISVHENMTVSEVKATLCKYRCPTLAGKPKIFFIDASRGEGTQNAVTLPKKENTESCQGVPAYTGNPIEVHLRQKGDIREEVIPKEIACHADFLKCWSTPPGYFSWRNTVTGSWFVQSLCQVLSRATGNEDIMDLLTKTNMVLNSTFQSNCPSIPNLHGKKQTAFFESTLTAKLYLTPSSFN
ncbi:caspase-1-like isoform X2 [Penaeus indicus]|uniref:caspase-1-like isoform X2 n=1 Tax=Penaeus indicus TaxID=29960 RepID=UPI00300CF015